MSGWGQSRHFDRVPLTTGLPQLAEILRVIRHVSKVPTAEVSDLFDHLVGQQLKRVRHGEAEGAGGLEIND